jgi:hypothetical protein
VTVFIDEHRGMLDRVPDVNLISTQPQMKEATVSVSPHPFKQLIQIGVLVHSVDETMRTYQEKYGIGPWEVYTVDPSTTQEMVLNGKRKDYGVRTASAKIGDLSIELIEPLDDHSRHAEILRTRGEGIEHLCFGCDSFDEATEWTKSKGNEVSASGLLFGTKYEIVSTQEDLKFDVEFWAGAEDMEFPAPESTYPPRES